MAGFWIIARLVGFQAMPLGGEIEQERPLERAANLGPRSRGWNGAIQHFPDWVNGHAVFAADVITDALETLLPSLPVVKDPLQARVGGLGMAAPLGTKDATAFRRTTTRNEATVERMASSSRSGLRETVGPSDGGRGQFQAGAGQTAARRNGSPWRSAHQGLPARTGAA